MFNPSRLALLLTLAVAPLAAQTTPPAAVPDPFASVAAGTGTASTPTCTTGTATTSGINLGDGCTPATAGVAAPQGVSVDRLGNVYIADYNDRALRVVYAGGANLAAAITAANSGYAISSTRSAPATVPTVGNIYTFAGFGSTATAVLAASGTTYPCANYAATGQPAALNALGDGCPAASAPIAPRAVTPDSDGNLFLTDYGNGRIRVLCVNCAATTNAAQLITLENPGVTPVNGAMYTISGYANGFRDAALGFGSAPAATAAVALLRSPTQSAVSAADDVYIADQGNNAVRLLYNGGAAALALLTAQGITPTRGFVYVIAGAGCVSAATGKTGSVSSANSCLTLTPTDAVAGNASGVNTPWSIFLDPHQNLFLTDAGNERIRVLYGGLANPLTLTGTLNTGSIYTFAGANSFTTAGTPTAAVNGITPAALTFTTTVSGTTTSYGAQGVSGDASGNLFLVDYTRNTIFEVFASTGTLTALAGNTPAATLAAGANCNGLATGPTSTNPFGDGCPATQSKLLTPRGPVAVDTLGNLLFGDSANNIVQKYAYAAAFAATAAGTPTPAQPIAFTTNGQFTINGTIATQDFSIPSLGTCAGMLAPGATCATSAVFTPTRAGLRRGAAILPLPDGTPVATYLLSGIGLGAALNTDPAIPTNLGANLQPAAVAVSPAGRILVADLASKAILSFTGTTQTTLATGFSNPSGLAVDGAGNVFVADATANTVRVLPFLSTVSFAAAPYTLLTSLNAPRGLAFDPAGNLLIANTGSNQVLTVAPSGTIPSVVPFTGLNGPQAVAADAAGNLYVADTGNARILKLTPAGVQTIVANIVSSGLALDPAGNLLTFSGTTLNQYLAGTGTATPVLTGLAAPRAVALDSLGNVYIADQGKSSLLTLNRTVPAFTFTSSPSSNLFTLTSTGNIAFTPATPFLTNSDATHFTVAAASTNGCSGALAPGTTCNLNTTFASSTAGTFTDNVAFNGNATNAPGLTLTGTNTAESTTTTFTPGATAVTYGTAITFTATVRGTATTPTAGSISFRGGNTTYGTANVAAGGVATASIVLPAGVLAITATFTPASINYAPSTSPAQTITVTPAVLTATVTSVSRQFGAANPAFTYTLTGFVNGDTQASATTGTPVETTTAVTTSPQGTYPITITAGTLTAANYAFTFSNGTLTVTPARPAVVLTPGTTSTFVGTPVTLAAAVTSSVGTPTGTVTFYSGTTSLGVVTLAGSSATLTTTALPLGTDSITAVYSGDPGFAAVTSSAISIFVDIAFGLSASSTALTFPRNYQEAQAILTINPGGHTDNLSFNCAGLPAKVSCTFTPTTLALAGLVGPQQVTLLVSNSGATASLTRSAPVFAGLFALGLLAFKRRRRRLPGLLLLLCFAAALTGCGLSAIQQSTGTYNFNVVVSSGSAIVQTIPFTLNVQ